MGYCPVALSSYWSNNCKLGLLSWIRHWDTSQKNWKIVKEHRMQVLKMVCIMTKVRKNLLLYACSHPLTRILCSLSIFHSFFGSYCTSDLPFPCPYLVLQSWWTVNISWWTCTLWQSCLAVAIILLDFNHSVSWLAEDTLCDALEVECVSTSHTVCPIIASIATIWLPNRSYKQHVNACYLSYREILAHAVVQSPIKLINPRRSWIPNFFFFNLNLVKNPPLTVHK